ncbi:MAG TPA: Nudix family hydrolase [Rhodanobacteraceae bacterium]|jgi:8-oxo-dGTP diphosphatase|nr:Nudix family hydrolase [Rhodanobacteraceae bacterium]
MTQVAAGILADARGRVLLMQRLPGKHLAGLWEFPGGKLEPGETIEQALARELSEELGVAVTAAEPLISIPWHYPEKSVRLHAWRVTAWRGVPHAREGHPLRWVDVRDMDVATMPAADAPIVSALRLPVRYAITGSKMVSGTIVSGSSSNRDGLSLMVPAGVRRDDTLVQLRSPNTPRGALRHVAGAWLAAEPSLRARLLVNHDIDLARELGIGVHLRASQLRELRQRPLPPGAWVGASCHDAEELELAARLGADFATLSPVCVTATHPHAVPLGWDRFARLVADARLPVYALGGIGPDDLASAKAAGGQGVAGIRAFLNL